MNFQQKNSNQHRDYLSGRDLESDTAKTNAHIQGRTDEEQRLNRNIKKHAKASKLEDLTISAGLA